MNRYDKHAVTTHLHMASLELRHARGTELEVGGWGNEQAPVGKAIREAGRAIIAENVEKIDAYKLGLLLSYLRDRAEEQL